MEMFDYEKKHLQTLRESLAECTVLLKSNGDFPLAAPTDFAANILQKQKITQLNCNNR